MHEKVNSLGLLWGVLRVQSAQLRTKSVQHGTREVPLQYLQSTSSRSTRICALQEEIQPNRIWVQLFFGLSWGPTYTRPVPLCGSDLEDRLMRSAGRCSPLVTFTISPTATYMSQFKRIKMGRRKKKEETNNRENKNQTNGQKRQKVWNYYRRGFMLIKMSNADFFKTYFDQAWRERWKCLILKDRLFDLKLPNFTFLRWKSNILKLTYKHLSN